MTWPAENGFWALFGVASIAMHHFGLGCHGGHGSQGGRQGSGGKPLKKQSNEPGAKKRPGRADAHRHLEKKDAEGQCPVNPASHPGLNVCHGLGAAVLSDLGQMT